MVSKNVVAIYKEFRRIKDQVNYIQSMYEQDVDKTLEVRALSTEPGFVEAAYELLDDVKEFVKLIEESDPNLDPDTTKLEGVDNLFKGHFVTDHMNNVFNEVYNSQGVCSNEPCKADDKNCCKNEIKSAILRATDPVEPFVRPNPGCKLVCTRNHCSCEDGW